jgi:hypothetical protein
VFDTERIAFTEVAFVYFPTAGIFDGSCRRACHGAETALGAEEFIYAHDAVIALFDGPCGTGGKTKGFAAMLAEYGEVLALLFISDNLHAGRDRGDFCYIPRGTDHLAGAAACASVGMKNDKRMARRHEVVGKMLLLHMMGPEVIKVERIILFGDWLLCSLLFGHLRISHKINLPPAWRT